DGSFQVQAPLPVGQNLRSLVVADFNGDGHLDLAAADSSFSGQGSVWVLLGRGDGLFQVQAPLPVSLNPLSLVVADVNGDGRLDLATANEFSDSASVLLGRGDGSFQAQAPVPVGSNPLSLVVADLNGDGRLDLATVNGPSFNQGSVSVLL